MIVLVRRRDPEAHDHPLQEWWIGQRQSGLGEVRAGVEDQFVDAWPERFPFQERAVGSPVGVGFECLQQLAAPGQRVQLDPAAGCGPAVGGVEDVGGQTAHAEAPELAQSVASPQQRWAKVGSFFNIGDRVSWQVGSRRARGQIKTKYLYTVTKRVREGAITQRGSEEDPALLIECDDGSEELRLESEVEKTG